jgi:ABC-2 type transport system ATP-binding protein
MPPLLKTTELSRSYGHFQALAPTSLEMNSGEVIAITGMNGAGKTTLLLCLSGLLRPSRGQVAIEGYDLYQDERPARERLAFVPDVPRFYQELTAWEHLRFIALAHSVEKDFPPRAERLMREFDLWESRDLYPHNFSRGMRLKLGLLLALIRPVKVLLLDEPTSALDPTSAHLLEEKLLDLRSQGGAVLFTTHNPEQAARLADRTLHMEHGRLSGPGIVASPEADAAPEEEPTSPGAA